MQLQTTFEMESEDILFMIGLKLQVLGYLENTLRYTTPFKNSEKPSRPRLNLFPLRTSQSHDKM